MATVEQRPPAHQTASWQGPPPRLSIGQAISRSWWVLAICVLAFVGAAVAIGLVRKPEYTAEARLNVGKIDVTSQQLPGYVEATKSLAASYARAMNAEVVVRRLAGQARLSPAYVDSHVSATPVPDAPVITISVTGRPPARTVTLANDAADVLVRYVTSVNQSSPESRRLLRRFHNVTLAASRALIARDALLRKVQAGRGAPGDETRLLGLRARADSLVLEKTTLSSLYQQAQQADSATAAVEILSRAGSAKSDRTSFLERIVLAALILGALVGAGLAVLRSNLSVDRISRRRF